MWVWRSKPAQIALTLLVACMHACGPHAAATAELGSAPRTPPPAPSPAGPPASPPTPRVDARRTEEASAAVFDAPDSLVSTLRAMGTASAPSRDDIALTHCALMAFCAPVSGDGWERALRVCRERPLIRSEGFHPENTRRCVNLLAQSPCDSWADSGLAYLYCAHSAAEAPLCSPCPAGSAFRGYGDRPCECHAYPSEGETCLLFAPWTYLTCADGLACIYDPPRCVPGRGRGERCDGEHPCLRGLFCYPDGVCRRSEATVGRACDRHCGVGDPTCRSLESAARCVSWPQPGDRCDPECQVLSAECVPCAQGALCVDGRCRVVVVPGGSCGPETACIPGFECIGGRCLIGDPTAL